MNEQTSRGQRDYEASVARTPNYHDGTPRKRWDQLRPFEQGSWERDPQTLAVLVANSGVLPKGTRVRVRTTNGGELVGDLLEWHRPTYYVALQHPAGYPVVIEGWRVKSVEVVG